ncbi:hypothetical protein BKA82DRAFT_20470 [Pisolithus tinctorius]|uniref:Uncharacterized protein n=1 Tax=Pisolithus tinctorius Marx 270 TaxID=870435 RepID=A0A0C3JRW7_PISTI|nr:hypothetical protein BKA82DRAFT_20470 [Pisolithus tinctorius]KIO11883.1 hypothetical protein M404DRAFT_20470 [Pisolithus tinctorius Marx 270]
MGKQLQRAIRDGRFLNTSNLGAVTLVFPVIVTLQTVCYYETAEYCKRTSEADIDFQNDFYIRYLDVSSAVPTTSTTAVSSKTVSSSNGTASQLDAPDFTAVKCQTPNGTRHQTGGIIVPTKRFIAANDPDTSKRAQGNIGFLGFLIHSSTLGQTA